MTRQVPVQFILPAQQSMTITGVPASVTLAQGIDESDWFTIVPLGSNNYFGIKAAAGQPFVMSPTHEFINGVSKPVMAPFRKFATIAACFIAHGDLLSQHSQYTKAMLDKTNPLKFAMDLQGVYATDPNYGLKLQTLMTEEGLLKYDKVS